MKRIIMIITSTILILAAAGCGNNNGADLTTTPTARPFLMRSELLQQVQADYKILESEFNLLEDGNERKTELHDKMVENLTEQAAIMNGNDGEEKLDDLTAKLEEYLKTAKEYSNAGNKKKSDELMNIINNLMYGNSDGIKTW